MYLCDNDYHARFIPLRAFFVTVYVEDLLFVINILPL